MLHRNSASKPIKKKKTRTWRNELFHRQSEIVSDFASQMARRTCACVFRIYSMLYCVRKRKYYADSDCSGNYKFPLKTTARRKLHTSGVIDIRCWVVPISPMREDREDRVESGAESVGELCAFQPPQLVISND